MGNYSLHSACASNRNSGPMCSLLSGGQTFRGTQSVRINEKDEAHGLKVRILGCEVNHGYLCGTIESLNFPSTEATMATFWEGEIVDGKNYSFFTGKWEAAPKNDLIHWLKFSAFLQYAEKVREDGGNGVDMSNVPYIFMRWKEQYFMDADTDYGLSIGGFYYVCFSCADGSIDGFYYDPTTVPFQRLQLKADYEGRLGFSFSSYELQ